MTIYLILYYHMYTDGQSTLNIIYGGGMKMDEWNLLCLMIFAVFCFWVHCDHWCNDRSNNQRTNC